MGGEHSCEARPQLRWSYPALRLLFSTQDLLALNFLYIQTDASTATVPTPTALLKSLVVEDALACLAKSLTPMVPRLSVYPPRAAVGVWRGGALAAAKWRPTARVWRPRHDPDQGSPT